MRLTSRQTPCSRASNLGMLLACVFSFVHEAIAGMRLVAGALLGRDLALSVAETGTAKAGNAS